MAASRKNRIAGDVSSPEDHAQKVRPAVVRAYKAVVWRCPGCSLEQFSQRSEATHVEPCRRCGKEATVQVRSES
jgi:hypothetical protein